MKDLTLEIQPRAPSQELVLTIETGGGGEFDWYVGDYEVTPTRTEQVLPTKHKAMRENVVVNEIPYYETSNPYGTTFVIGE